MSWEGFRRWQQRTVLQEFIHLEGLVKHGSRTQVEAQRNVRRRVRIGQHHTVAPMLGGHALQDREASSFLQEQIKHDQI